VGNPHAVFFVEELTDELVLGLGPKIEHHRMFPNRINVEFVKVVSPTELEMRVWERGSGETFACGTGASAVAVAAVLNEFTERKMCIRLLGGNLELEWATDNHIYMTGPAKFVFDGELFVEEL
jgi:diaminopimelate epimerase